MSDKTTVLGIMSGSSLDGLDVCLTEFSKKTAFGDYRILEAQTIDFPEHLKKSLATSHISTEGEVDQLDQEFGEWIGRVINQFSKNAELIGLHGHTTIHDPSNQRSVQIGSGQTVADLTGKPTIVNFRMADILEGGQGAPLVPKGEKLLFPDYDGFLNLGGICNASIRINDGKWIAGDIGPFNQVLNFYSSFLGLSFDEGGKLALSGSIDSGLSEKWKDLGFFQQDFPKSLSNQWVQKNFFQEVQNPKDALRTFTSFITDRIAESINHFGPKKLMISGGGGFNHFAMDLLKQKVNSEIVVPADELINFKEALIFGLLGLLRYNHMPNVLSSCTGARSDVCGGDVYMPQ